jgi:hypothetical protein
MMYLETFGDYGAGTELTQASVRQHPQFNNGVDLFAHQDEYSSEYSEYRHDHPQTIEIHSRDKRCNARNYEPDTQQQHPYIVREIYVHVRVPFLMC